jgi:hypothetical protein
MRRHILKHTPLCWANAGNTALGHYWPNAGPMLVIQHWPIAAPMSKGGIGPLLAAIIGPMPPCYLGYALRIHIIAIVPPNIVLTL